MGSIKNELSSFDKKLGNYYEHDVEVMLESLTDMHRMGFLLLTLLENSWIILSSTAGWSVTVFLFF